MTQGTDNRRGPVVGGAGTLDVATEETISGLGLPELRMCLRSALITLRGLEAPCAAMREALELTREVLDHIRPFTSQVWGNPACSLEARDLGEATEAVAKALSGDAGRAHQERDAALERVASLAREWAREHSESALAEAIDALDALEAVRESECGCTFGTHASQVDALRAAIRQLRASLTDAHASLLAAEALLDAALKLMGGE